MRSSKLQQLRRLKKIVKRKRQDGLIQQYSESQTHELISDQNDHQEIDQHQSQPEPQVSPLEQQQFQEEFEDEYEQEQHQQNQQQNQEQWEDVGIQNQMEEQRSDKKKKTAYLGNNKGLKKGQYLEVENKAYDMLHRLTTQWPCLTVDFLIGDNPYTNKNRNFLPMDKYPYEIYTISGTQGEKANYLYLGKWSKLHKTKYDDQSEDYEDDQDNDLLNDQDPEINVVSVQTKHEINRLRTLNYSPIVAYWNENAEVTITNLTKKFRALRDGVKTTIKQDKNNSKDNFIFKQSSQGYAINWNPNKIGQLSTGNRLGQVFIYKPNQNLSGWQDGIKYTHHKGASVEDLQFAPEQEYAFATCSVDGTLQIIDTRVGNYKKAQLIIKAHQKDINTLDWNMKAKHLIATGSDDCTVKVWDLRMQKSFEKGIFEQLICFNWHTEPITSIAFQPNQQSVLAVASEDNRLTIWDLAVENEQQQHQQRQQDQIPNELMFLHQGQQDIKQIRYHPVYYEMITSTALNGLNTFKPSYDGGIQSEDQGQQDLKKPPIKQQQLEAYLQKLSLQ